MIEKFFLLIKFLFLGLFQGLTEPIPISSSGHLVLFRHLFRLEIVNLSFEIIVHFGSLIAIITVYRKELFKLINHSLIYIFNKNTSFKSDFLFTFHLLFATLITGMIGLLFENYISQNLTKPLFIGIALLLTSLFLW